MLNLLYKYLDKALLFIIFSGIVSALSEFLMTPRTISAICLYLLFFLNLKHSKKTLQVLNKEILLLSFLFFLSLSISALASENPLYSFHWIKKTYWVPLAIILGSISIDNRENLFKIFLGAMVTTLFVNNIYFYLKSVSNYHVYNLFSSDFVVDRNYSFLLGILLPFSFASSFYFRQIWVKIFCLINTIMGMLLLIPCGTPQGGTVRGAYITLFIEILILFIFLFHYIKIRTLPKKWFLAGSIGIILGLIYLFSLFSSHPIIKKAMQKGFSSSGRIVMIRERLPLVFKEHPFLGIGYGRLLYFSFLQKHNIKRGKYYDHQEKRYVYISDEGVFLQTLIRQGILGFLTFLCLYFYSVWRSFQIMFRTRLLLNKVLFFSVAAVLVGEYFFRGLVETLSLGPFFIVITPLFLKEKLNENRYSIS